MNESDGVERVELPTAQSQYDLKVSTGTSTNETGGISYQALLLVDSFDESSQRKPPLTFSLLLIGAKLPPFDQCFSIVCLMLDAIRWGAV